MSHRTQKRLFAAVAIIMIIGMIVTIILPLTVLGGQ